MALAVFGCGRIGIEHLSEGVAARGGADGEGQTQAGGEGGAPISTGGAGGATGGAPPIMHCEELPYLAAAPDLDGVMEPGMSLEPVTPVGWRDSTTPLPSGQSLSYAAAWRADGLYF